MGRILEDRRVRSQYDIAEQRKLGMADRWPLIAEMTGTSISRKAVSIRIPSVRIRIQN